MVTPSPVLSSELKQIEVALTQPTLQERATLIAEEFKISTTTFTNLIQSESGFDPDIPDSPQGDRGLLQINRRWHPEVSDECAYDAECAMRWAAKRIANGYIHEWTVANCYTYVSLFTKLPKMRDIVPNTNRAPSTVAIFQYNQKHIAYVTKIEDGGFWVKEANYKPALVSTRFVLYDDPSFLGFYKP